MDAAVKRPGSGLDYRPDIDGLRALAVLSVIGYHAFPRTVPGGFTGVDIFFVVSGYLISGIIYSDLGRQRFSYKRFYARRFRRIFPALALVLGTCLIYGWFALAPDEYRELGIQTAAGAGFGANILFWRETGYFDAAATAKPLLHLWSLGIEEQFYLLWPCVIVLAFGRGARLLQIVVAVILATFAANIVLTYVAPSAAFYLPVARFWELLVGAALAFLPHSAGAEPMPDAGRRQDQPLAGRLRPLGSGLLGLIGLLLITAALLLIDRGRRFPGWWALLPTAGAALVIATPGAWLNRKVLSTRVLVYIGLISYPLYLWHWVLLSFGRIANYGDELPRSWRLALVASAFALAALTYHLIERPIRFSPNRARMPLGVIASMVICGLLGLLAYRTDGAVFRYPALIRPLAAARYDTERNYYDDDAYRGGTCFLDTNTDDFTMLASRCVDGANAASPLVVLWGDSHAASLYPGLRAEQAGANYRIAQFTASACPPILGVEQQRRPNCKQFNDAVLTQIRASRPAVVLLEAHWALYVNDRASQLDTMALRQTIYALEQSGVARIVVMGSLPSWKIYQPRAAFEIWRRTHMVAQRSSLFLDSAAFSTDDQVRQAVAGTGAIFVSPLALLCNRSGCLLSTDPHHPTPVAWDNDHLSVAGSCLLIQLALTAILG